MLEPISRVTSGTLDHLRSMFLGDNFSRYVEQLTEKAKLSRMNGLLELVRGYFHVWSNSIMIDQTSTFL